jgi:cytochrome c-type biogenesis protein CcmH/NrfG
LKQAARDDPRCADRWADLAEHYLHVRDNGGARKCAMVANRLEKNHPRASLVLAKLCLSGEDRQQAKLLLRQSLDEQKPDFDALTLLASLTEMDGEREEAERLCRLGVERFPLASQWLKSLSRIYLKSDERRKLSEVLALLAEMEGDDFALRKKLLQLCAEAGDLEDAVRWGIEAYQIDVTDAEVHATLGDVYARKTQYDRSTQEYATAVRLSPKRVDWQLALAENCLHADDRQRAMETVHMLLEQQPGHQGATRLLKKIRTTSEE